MAAVVVLVVLSVVAVALVRAYAEVDGRFVAEWAGAHGLTLTRGNRPMVWWYLRNARVLRTWGVLGGVTLPPVAMAASGIQGAGGPAVPAGLFAGHLAGALYAEIALRRPVAAGTRTALVDRRDLTSYLPRHLRAAPAVVATATAVLAVLVLRAGGVDPDRRREALVLGLLGPAVAVAIALTQRWLVRRSQPFRARDLVEADDAIRSQSVHQLAGSGTAVLLTLLGAAANVAADSGLPGRAALSMVVVLSWPAAVVSCLFLGHRAWRVRRHIGRTTVAVP
ncbi:MAG: hypothetical protein AB7H43_07540 [Acidimicrobiia bacterium]